MYVGIKLASDVGHMRYHYCLENGVGHRILRVEIHEAHSPSFFSAHK